MRDTIAANAWNIGANRFRLLLCCFFMCLLAVLPGASQEDNLTCQSISVAGYANVAFCLPSEVSVVLEDLAEANYTKGREAKALLILNSNEVYLHLLYPCTIHAGLSESEIKSHIEAYDPHIKTAGYIVSPLAVNNWQAVWGEIGNWTFVAWQAADNALALMYLDTNMPDEIQSNFLQSLDISVDQTISPLSPEYCQQMNLNQTAQPAIISRDSITGSYVSAEGNLSNYQGSEAEAGTARFEETRERMAYEMEETRQRLDETKERLEGYGMIQSPFILT